VEVRCQALLTLSDLRASSATADVLELLSDPELRVRQMAIVCLGEIAEKGDRDIANRLALLLRAGDAKLRYQALLAYCQLSPGAAEADILRALADPDPEVRELSVRLIDEILVPVGGSLDEATTRALKQACLDGERRVRTVAQLLCAQLSVAAERSEIYLVVRGKCRVREPRDEQTAIELAGHLGLVDLQEDLRRRAFGVLGISFDPFRWVALGALVELGDEKAFARVTAALNSRRYMERTMAAQAIGQARAFAFAETLERFVGKEDLLDQDVLKTAIDACANPARLAPQAG
jgi:HEAT repeat protein